MVPPEPPATIPGGLTCGFVRDVTEDGVIQSPGFPDHLINQDCAFVLRAPGFGFDFTFPDIQLEQRYMCETGFLVVSDSGVNSIKQMGSDNISPHAVDQSCMGAWICAGPEV